MNSVTTVLLFGSLSRFHPGKKDEAFEFDLQSPAAIPEVLDLLNIPVREVNLTMVNFRSVPKDFVVQPGDRLALFPREYPVFADWLDHRF